LRSTQGYIQADDFQRLNDEARSVKNLIGEFRRYLRTRSVK